MNSKYIPKKSIRKKKEDNKFLVYVAGSCPQSYKSWLTDALDDREIEIVEIKTISDLRSIDKYPDLVLYTGGADVDPSLYGESKGKYTSCNPKRDEFENEFWNLFNSGGRGLIPKLGICRGAQFITARSGGKVIQHVEGHGVNHTIITNTGKRFTMTSDHHQMMYPFNVKNAEILAWSEYFKSSTYLNGDNKEIDLPRNFVEPEIVFYQNKNALCIQGHPEYSSCATNTSVYCKDLVKRLADGTLISR